MDEFPIVPPTDNEIDEAQEKLNFKFPPEYIEFLKSGYDLGDIPIDALEIVDPPSYADIYIATKEAHERDGFPKTGLPICKDNGDYYYLNELGEVVYWSHNGSTDEKWTNVIVWRDSMIREFEGDKLEE
ncbi:SMI1/KNR4 family protein [Alteromonas sediminis]|uniref:SMI1/KNR4 family protein n=1 Tax=Alteromonas sediminis TaxID=2259342 RepID=A0A3N5XZB7_9ALTE|nr:SMI1/KNR4 family protein [Alteromonas sediminis]RPJ66080.1 SMI1/KNR4 family protein [Alteromonas sediminis]